MAEGIRDISLSDLVVGKGQVRVSDTDADISELANSIRKIGLLEPIIVSPSTMQKGKYEILAGQRRFLAHQELQAPTIRAIVRERSVDRDEGRIISLTENLMRRNPSRKDLIDACTALYKKYGSISMVAQETGLSAAKVSDYVRYDQLIQPLKDLVDANQLDVGGALRAQKAAGASGTIDPDAAVTFAKAMGKMSNAQQRKVVDESEEMPGASPEELIEAAKTTSKVVQIQVTLSDTIHKRLQRYAKDEGTAQDDAAASLIQQGLEGLGYLE